MMIRYNAARRLLNMVLAMDAGDFKEQDHPRAKNGQFAKKGQGGAGAAPAAKPAEKRNPAASAKGAASGAGTGAASAPAAKSPTDQELKSDWAGAKKQMSALNRQIVFGSASQKDRTLKQFTGLQKAYNALVQRGGSIARDLEGIVKSAGGELYGKEFGIKGAGSLERKLNSKMAKKETSPEEAFKSLTDVVRFTSLCSDDEIPKIAQNLVAGFRKKGYTLVEIDNKWLDSSKAYKGLHFLFRSPGENPVTFEVQVHSPEGMKIKNRLHELYEVSRDPSVPKNIQEKADADQWEIAKDYKKPKGIESIKSWKLSE